MNNIDKYIKFIKDYLTEYFKLIVKDKYKKNVYNEMLNTYIDIRYFNIKTIIDVVEQRKI